VRCAILRLDAADHVILLTMHHIISDGWSLGIFFRELAALYQERNGGAQAVLPELQLQYGDFAIWQRKRLAGPEMERRLSYWRERLAGAPVLDLPLDYPRPPAQTSSGTSISTTISRELALALRQLSQHENVTLFVTLLAAFQVLLSRHSGQKDIVIGTPMAGRSRRELENLIGLFVNTLVIRTDLSGTPTFRELLLRTRDAVVGAYENQDIPFEMLVETLQLSRDLSRSPVFQVFFNMISFVDKPLTLTGLQVESLAAPEIGSKFDLTLYAGENGETLNLFLLYNLDLFCFERMADWLRQLHNLLWQIVEAPDRSIDEYSLLSQAAAVLLPDPSATLLQSWQGGVQQRFARRAAEGPDRIAIVEGNRESTYRQLDDSSDQLANYLQAHEIRQGDMVAVYATRCAALVHALLGVLKAGAAFVILDSTYPAAALIERLRATRSRGWIQLAEAGPLAPALSEFLNAGPPHCRLELSAFSATVADATPASLLATTSREASGPEDLAYVAFTSGTTGQFQGILGTHAPLSHFISWHSRTHQLGPTDRFAMLSGLAHDPLLRDIFTPLSIGGTLCIPSSDDITLPGHLADWLLEKKISVLHLTPGLAQMMTLSDKSVSLPDLRYAFFAAEALSRRDVAYLQHIAPNVTCVNFYGATETPQAVGCYVVRRDPAWGDPPDYPHFPIPLGRGIEAVQLLVLNDRGRLCGIGELGEIHVRSPYLAKGYLANSALTRDRFIANPFTLIAEDRLYRSGDLARYLPTGNVEFAGRADDQVKIRGFRVEPRMVEAVLDQCVGVLASCVVARPQSGGERQLVAYVVPESGAKPDIRSLRSFLQDRLPEYTLPAAFVMLEHLPLTPNGKLDRGRLPDPDPNQWTRLVSLAEPHTPIEKKLASIWSELLGVAQIGAKDSFFELGGHSLLAVRLLSRISSACDVDLPLRCIFENPTLSGLATVISSAPSRKLRAPEPALRKLSRKHSVSAQNEPSGDSLPMGQSKHRA
jgi:amino acid adenylation domain-containing protein